MQIRHDHPLPEIILQWRKLNSILKKVVKKIGDVDRIDSYVRQQTSLHISYRGRYTYKFIKESCVLDRVVWYCCR